MTTWLSPTTIYQTSPATKKEEILKRSSLRGAAFLSSSSQQPFSAALLSSLSQQLFSAAFLSSLSQQLFSAAFLRSSSQQLFSAAFLSSFLSAALLSYHLAVVRGWWSASNFSQQLSLSSLSQELFSAAFLSSSSQLSSCCGPGLVVS